MNNRNLYIALACVLLLIFGGGWFFLSKKSATSTPSTSISPSPTTNPSVQNVTLEERRKEHVFVISNYFVNIGSLASQEGRERFERIYVDIREEMNIWKENEISATWKQKVAGYILGLDTIHEGILKKDDNRISSGREIVSEIDALAHDFSR